MEKNAAKETSKRGAKLTTLNMNEGIIASLPGTSVGGEDKELDVDIAAITRKKLDVKADNINMVFQENIGTIAEQVNTFAQMEDEIVASDPNLLYERQKKQYDEELEQI